MLSYFPLVYVRIASDERGPVLYALDALAGTVLWHSDVGNTLFSFPQPGQGDMVYLSSNTGEITSLRCPKDAQFVVDRMVYVCPELTMVPPTQEDLCSELYNECKDTSNSGTSIVVPSFMR